MRFSISRQLRMYHSDIDVLFSYFLRRFATDRSLLQYICSMIRVTLSLIRATLFQFFTFCLLIHLNTERENLGGKRPFAIFALDREKLHESGEVASHFAHSHTKILVDGIVCLETLRKIE